MSLNINNRSTTNLNLDGRPLKILSIDGREVYSAGGLPNRYQQVEYLESTGAQYIDTGIIPTRDCKIELTLQYTSAEAWKWAFGVFVGELHWLGLRTTNKSNTIDFLPFGGSVTKDGTTILEKHNYILDLKNKYYYVDGTRGSLPWTNFYELDNIYIFALNYTSGQTVPRFSEVKMFEYIYYENDIKLQHFIPCYRKSDNKPGMYDLIGRKFYTNAGSGDDFILGPDV